MVWPDFNFSERGVVFSNFVFDAIDPTGALHASVKDVLHNITAWCPGSICQTDGYEHTNNHRTRLVIIAAVRC